MTLFETVYGHLPPTIEAYENDTTIDHHVEQELLQWDRIFKLLKDNLVSAQARMKAQADKHRSEHSFEIGEMVFLKLQPYRQSYVALGSSTKLAPSYYVMQDNGEDIKN